MKKIEYMRKRMKRIIINVLVLLLVNTLYMCEEEEPQLHQTRSFQQVMTEFILDEDNADLYSEFGEMLVSTGLNNLLAVRGPYTLFLPTNEAMQEFYQEMGIITFSDLGEEEVRRLVLNHLISNEIRSGEIGLGTLRDTNALGDFVVTEFSGSDIIVNKRAKIIDRDVIAANGVIHIIDEVLPPIDKDVFTILKETPGFSIFTEGLEITGLDDTLSIISFPYGKYVARTRFTLLAVPDTLYEQNGINTVGDLIALYAGGNDNYTELSNGFYRYMEYHCLAGTYYLSQLETRNYPILSYDNNVSMDITDDYKINLDTAGVYTAFVLENSNIPAKNGAIHTITGLLPVTDVAPKSFTFYVTHYFDFQQGDYYKLNQYAKFDDGDSTFKYIKWNGDYLQYYYKDHDSFSTAWENFDGLNMNGYWWIEFTLPKIQKGKYRLTAIVASGSGYTDCLVYVDGVLQEDLFTMSDSQNLTIAEVNWPETERHTLKLVGLNPSLFFMDGIVFDPID